MCKVSGNIYISDNSLKNFEFCFQLEEVKRQPNVKCTKLCSILPESETQRALNLFLVHAGN